MRGICNAVNNLSGQTWVQSNVTSGYFNTPVYANNKWVIGSSGGIYYSTNVLISPQILF